MGPKNLLKIFCLNIETDRHFDRVIPFIKKHQPDMVLMQEVYERNVPFIEDALSMKGFFSVLTSFKGIENSRLGLLNLTVLSSVRHQSIYYRGSGENPSVVRSGHGEGANTARAIAITDFFKGEHHHSVINTHFTWTPDGLPRYKQYVDIDKMLELLSIIPEFILCGDFNAPRGGPIFEKIASKYQDNIPQTITTTIDKNLHKAGDLNLVVDGMFTTQKYTADSIEIVSGVSDHCGVLATFDTKRDKLSHS